ncbi:hypothetical protein C5167_041525 [Papaver somniferum]|nr:hypothetical protein C5167_041525 [Papaver somniferum]
MDCTSDHLFLFLYVSEPSSQLICEDLELHHLACDFGWSREEYIEEEKGLQKHRWITDLRWFSYGNVVETLKS